MVVYTSNTGHDPTPFLIQPAPTPATSAWLFAINLDKCYVIKAVYGMVRLCVKFLLTSCSESDVTVTNHQSQEGGNVANDQLYQQSSLMGSTDSGITSACGRKFQTSWKSKYQWINYSTSENKVYCQVCQKCDELKLFTFTHQRDDAFTLSGFDNWKHALAKFSKHELSKSHREAVLKVDNAIRGTNIASHLSQSHQRDRELARSALLCLVSSLHYLCVQGLAIRGHTEDRGNFENLLQLRANDNSALKSWLQKSGYKWLSPAIQNEIIQDLALAVLRSFQQDVIEARYFAIIMDETTDASCKEQVSICLRYVSKKLQVQETFTGFYETPATTAITMFEVATDVLTRFQLQLSNCRGQCFDGASNMSGRITGLQKRITDVQPKALYVHCMNHSLNLAFQDSISCIPQCRDAMNQVRELINFVRDSPKRLAWFSSLQQQDAGALRPLCPTRWTMRICSVKSVLDNYNELLCFLEEVSQADHSEAGSKCSGYAKQLSTFSMYFSLKMLYTVFSRSETLAHLLQSPKLSLAKAEKMVDSLSSIWKCLRSDSSFSMLWQSVMAEAESIGIEPPVLPRQRRIPRRLDDAPQSQHNDERVEDFYRRLYFATVDSAIACLSQRFSSPAFKMACDIEALFIEVINTSTDTADEGWQTSTQLRNILSHYDNDIDASRLILHLSMLRDLCRSAHPPISVADTNDVIQIFNGNDVWSQMLSEVINLLQLYLTLPVTSCTAERSFSSLRRLKTFLRSTVTQKRLNHIAILHCHRDQMIDLEMICNTFILRNEMRQETFALFGK